MADKVVTASIDAKSKTVTLSPGTFVVDAADNDTLRWEVRGVPPGSTARVRFIGFVKAPEPPLTPPAAPLFKTGNTLEAKEGVIGGVIDDECAGKGLYVYVLDLVDPEGRAIELKRVSSAGEEMSKPVGMRPPGPGRGP